MCDEPLNGEMIRWARGRLRDTKPTYINFGRERGSALDRYVVNSNDSGLWDTDDAAPRKASLLRQ